MLDIDGFKRFNDTYGHLEGDKRLREVAEILKSSVRKNDVVVRYGGDEFLLVLHADENDAKRVMKRIEEELQRKSISISYGFKRWFPHEAVDDVLKEADQRMYEMKQEKQNHISETSEAP